MKQYTMVKYVLLRVVFHHHHHVQEGFGLIPFPCILKMKLVPPSLPRSSYVFWSLVYVLLVYIVVLVWVSYLCPSSVCVVATFPGTVLFPLLYALLLFFPQYIVFLNLVLYILCSCFFPSTLFFFFLYLVLLFQVSVSKISSVLLLNIVPLFSSVPRLHFQVSMLL